MYPSSAMSSNNPTTDSRLTGPPGKENDGESSGLPTPNANAQKEEDAIKLQL